MDEQVDVPRLMEEVRMLRLELARANAESSEHLRMRTRNAKLVQRLWEAVFAGPHGMTPPIPRIVVGPGQSFEEAYDETITAAAVDWIAKMRETLANGDVDATTLPAAR